MGKECVSPRISLQMFALLLLPLWSFSSVEARPLDVYSNVYTFEHMGGSIPFIDGYDPQRNPAYRQHEVVETSTYLAEKYLREGAKDMSTMQRFLSADNFGRAFGILVDRMTNDQRNVIADALEKHDYNPKPFTRKMSAQFLDPLVSEIEKIATYSSPKLNKGDLNRFKTLVQAIFMGLPDEEGKAILEALQKLREYVIKIIDEDRKAGDDTRGIVPLNVRQN